MEVSRARLADLLVDPREALDFGIKNWLDLQGSNDDKATFAKAVLALANHGGGFIAFGLEETAEGVVEAPGRPATLDGYSQDLVNGIAKNYCDPQFHCAVHAVPKPTGAVFPVVVVPGGHKVPIRARRAGPNGNTVQNNAIYIRRPGPSSETPQSAQDWEDLLARCLRNRRDEMFDQIRDLITGAVPQVDQAPEPLLLDKWTRASRERWEHLIAPLPADTGPRFPFGRFGVSYEIDGQRKQIAPDQFLDVLRRSVVRHTGWPPFWVPTRDGITPYLFDGAVECWLGGDQQTPPEQRDAAHSDFWRIHPQGLAYILRGYDEDSMSAPRNGQDQLEPGTAFDITLPVWRIGEVLLQAKSLAEHLFDGPTTIRFLVTYEGLADRSLVSVNSRRHLWRRDTAHQDAITLNTHVDAQAIDPNLPEIVHPLLSPLYRLFNFFELPMELVVEELAQMRGRQF